MVIAARHNERELTGDPTAHAEVLAIRDAARRGRPLATARLHAVRHPRAVRDVRRRARQRPHRPCGVRRRPIRRPAPWPACTRCAVTRGSTTARLSPQECRPTRPAPCCGRSSPPAARRASLLERVAGAGAQRSRGDRFDAHVRSDLLASAHAGEGPLDGFGHLIGDGRCVDLVRGRGWQ